LPDHLAKSVIVPVVNFGYGLILDNKPISIEWGSYWDGSIVRLICQAYPREDTSFVQNMVVMIRSLLSNGIVDMDVPLAEQFRDLVNLLSPGTYNVSVICMGSNSSVPFKKNGADYYSLIDWSEYPFTDMNFSSDTETRRHLFLTEKKSRLNRERIDYYIEKIEKGVRPLMFIVQIGIDYFLIDGHHKYEAYKETKQWPIALCVGTKRIRTDRPNVTCDYDGFCLESDNFDTNEISNLEKSFFSGIVYKHHKVYYPDSDVEEEEEEEEEVFMGIEGFTKSFLYWSEHRVKRTHFGF